MFKRIRHSLKFQTVILTLLVMLSAGLLTGCGLLILYFFNLISKISFTPLAIPFMAIVSCVIIGTLIATIFSRKILKPINELIYATRSVAKGDFSIRVDESMAGGELGDLLKSFNTMTAELGGIELFKNDFINTFSHEFKTPIVSIRGFAKRLKKDNITSEQKDEYTNIILSESETLATLSSNILLLSKYENQKIITDKTIFSIDEQIRNIILLFEKQWSSKNIKLDIDLDSVDFDGNESMISLIWKNLLSNSIKFTPTDGEISISLRKSKNTVKFLIKDTGEGMDAETLNHIFEKFYQGDSSHSSEGNGLGLSLVKRVTELCGGYIRVESQPKQGTCFAVELPLE